MSLYDPANLVLKVLQSIGLEQGESWIWPYLMCFVGGAAEPLTGNREPLAAGETAPLIEAFSGLPYIQCAIGEDYILKAVFLSFSEPILYEQLQTIGGVQQHTCYCIYPMNTPNAYTPWYLGWARSFLENINVASNTIIQVTNMGNYPATGKIWLIGKKRLGAYTTWL